MSGADPFPRCWPSVSRMTVAVLVKVYEGIVLATDSATTLPLPNGDNQVYNNANKVFHLHRVLPVAAMTWGRGAVGNASISTLAKDFRARMMGQVAGVSPLDASNYTVQGVATGMRDMIYDELAPEELPGALGLLITGYSAGCSQPEAWLVEGNVGAKPVPSIRESAPQDAFGWEAWAQPEAASRLFNGFDPRLPEAVLSALPADSAARPQIEGMFAAVRNSFNPAHPAMPIGDAIKLARFTAEMTSTYTRFHLGSDTVGGPIEVAAITRHEGFKWISRKHYFTTDLNPGGSPWQAS